MGAPQNWLEQLVLRIELDRTMGATQIWLKQLVLRRAGYSERSVRMDGAPCSGNTPAMRGPSGRDRIAALV